MDEDSMKLVSKSSIGTGVNPSEVIEKHKDNTDYDVCDEKSSEINKLPPSKVQVGFSKYPENENGQDEEDEVIKPVDKSIEDNIKEEAEDNEEELMQDIHTLSN